ncbi:MAG: Ribosome maturation factor rimM [Firmicutes bacterium]|nr:Ribosome maturation factor rimM [Bacillota bacterium]
MVDNLIAVGKIVAPHGVRGDVRIIPLTDFPDRFRPSLVVYLSDRSPLVINQVKQNNQFLLLKFKSFDDRNSVESLRGQLIHVKEQDLVALPKGQFYIFEIIGLQVYDEADVHLGVVTNVLQTGSNDVYVIEKPGEKPILIPALKEVVRQVDIAGKKMIVKLQEEWVE